jgi:RecJ-like exonuclease
MSWNRVRIASRDEGSGNVVVHQLALAALHPTLSDGPHQIQRAQHAAEPVPIEHYQACGECAGLRILPRPVKWAIW